MTDLAAATADTGLAAMVARAQGGKIQLRTGAKPSSADANPTGTLLAEYSLDATPFGASSNGVVPFADVPLQATPVASGTAGHYRIVTSSGTPVFQGTAGASGSGAEMVLQSTAVSAGVTITFTIGSYTLPLS